MDGMASRTIVGRLAHASSGWAAAEVRSAYVPTVVAVAPDVGEVEAAAAATAVAGEAEAIVDPAESS